METVSTNPPTVREDYFLVDMVNGGSGWEAQITAYSGAIRNRLWDVYLTVRNVTRSTSYELADPCGEAGGTSVTVPADPGDELYLDVCNGNEPLQQCAAPVRLMTLGQLDLDGAEVFDMWRYGSQLLVHRAGNYDDQATLVSLEDPWAYDIANTFPVSGLRGFAHFNWNAALYIADSNLVYRPFMEIPPESFEVLGSGVNIDASLRHGNHLLMAGSDPSGILFGSATLDLESSNVLCTSDQPALLAGTEFSNALALIPLPNHLVGIVLDDLDNTVLLVDISDPKAPRLEGSSLNLTELSSVAVKARVEDDHLVVWDETDSMYIYHLPGTGEMATIQLDFVNSFAAGGESYLATAYTRADRYHVVGYDDGLVVYFNSSDWIEARSIQLPGGSRVLALTETHGVVFAATSLGVFLTSVEPSDTAELHRTGARLHGQYLYFDNDALSFPQGGARITVWGDGIDQYSDPQSVQTELQVSEPWTGTRLSLPAELDGATNIVWDGGMVEAINGGGVEYFEIEALGNGPAYLESDCFAGANACGTELVAAGTGWRAFSVPGSDTVSTRWSRDGGGWDTGSLSLNNVQAITAGAMEDRLLISGDSLKVVIMTEPETPYESEIDPFTGVTSGQAIGINANTSVVAQADGLALAAINLSDPFNPTVYNPGGTGILDGSGRVVDFYHDATDGNLWLLAAAPNRLVQLDASQLPSFVVTGEWSLGTGVTPLAFDGGRFVHPITTATMHGLWIVMEADSGVHFVELWDTADLSAAYETVTPPGSAHDIFVGDCGGSVQILLAAGLDAGVIEMNHNGAEWVPAWVADMGDVRGLALVNQPYKPGEEWPETCSAQKTVVTGGCDARIFALSEFGVLAVPVGLCGCEWVDPSAVAEFFVSPTPAGVNESIVPVMPKGAMTHARESVVERH